MFIKIIVGSVVLALAVIVAACSSGDDGAASDGPGSVTEQTSPAQGQIVSTGPAELVDSYPPELALPGAELESSSQELEASGLFTFAVYRIEADTESILDFYESAFAGLGV